MTKETQSNTQKVLEILNKAVTGISVQELCKQLTLTFEEVMTSVRWIAREYNIGLASNNGNLMVIGVEAS